MRAVRVLDGEAVVQDVEMAEPPDGWVVLDVTANGICGSDHHLIEMGVEVTLGHEIAGRDPDGRAFAVQPIEYCGSCVACVDGRTDLCRALTGPVGVLLDGGLAEQVAVPPSCLVPLDDGLDPAHACLVEPVAVAVHAVNRAELADGDHVLVIGGGPIGLAAGVAAAGAGAQVELVARHPHQVAAGERLELPVAAGRDYDVVIEAAGHQSALVEAIDRCRPGGKVAIPGVYWEPVTLTQPAIWLSKQIDLKPTMYYGHHHGRRETDLAAELLAQRPDLADVLITHRFPLDDAPQAFAVAADRAAGAIKVVIEPD
ncbi:MAG: zinc-dependent alcohol dehydrogenase [Acidimicrobiales bacterium]